jgi:hypothetical protein
MLSYKEHSQNAKLSKELQSLNGFNLVVGSEIRKMIISSLGGTKNECTIAFADILVKLLAAYKWVHQIWIVGEDRPRVINSGSLDLILNPNLDGTGEQYETGMGPFGILISAKEKGNILGPASAIRFTIFIVIALKDSFFVAEDRKLFHYEYQESKRDLHFVEEIKGIPLGEQVIIGGLPYNFVKTIPDQEIRKKCANLQIAPVDNGLVSNLSFFMKSGGALVYANYPEIHLHSARLLVGELGPIAHLVSCAFGETRAAGGQNLISLRPTDQEQQVTAFIYTRNLKQQIDDLAFLWPL